jgi:hypothetical protein
MLGQIDLWLKEGKFKSPTEESEWRLAAAQFRLPYWDWARATGDPKKFAIPDVCWQEYVNIAMPGGIMVDYLNPLCGFQNPTTDSTGKPVAMGNATYMGVNTIKDNDSDKKNPPLPVIPVIEFSLILLTCTTIVE